MTVEPIKTKETIPLWLAVAVTVVVSLPFGLLLGRYNLPLWVSFIAWAEYFAFGAKPAAFRLILPSFAYGAILTAASMYAVQLLTPALTVNTALAVSLFVFVAFIVYSMRFWEVFTTGSLALFNGISMLLAVYFTRSHPPVESALLAPWVAGGWTVLAGWFGALLGWFNVLITFPRAIGQPTEASNTMKRAA